MWKSSPLMRLKSWAYSLPGDIMADEKDTKGVIAFDPLSGRIYGAGATQAAALASAYSRGWPRPRDGEVEEMLATCTATARLVAVASGNSRVFWYRSNTSGSDVADLSD